MWVGLLTFDFGSPKGSRKLSLGSSLGLLTLMWSCMWQTILLLLNDSALSMSLFQTSTWFFRLLCNDFCFICYSDVVCLSLLFSKLLLDGKQTTSTRYAIPWANKCTLLLKVCTVHHLIQVMRVTLVQKWSVIICVMCKFHYTQPN